MPVIADGELGLLPEPVCGLGWIDVEPLGVSVLDVVSKGDQQGSPWVVEHGIAKRIGLRVDQDLPEGEALLLRR